jgi:1-deoxy-D-xylulose-5-phosphate synthase
VEDGETHQGVFDIAYLRSVPNFTVLAPKDTRELRNMLYTAVRQLKGPIAVRFPRDRAIDAENVRRLEEIDYTRWEVLQEGDKVAILAYGAMVDTALQALPLLQERGLNPTVINARSCKPLDTVLLRTVIEQDSLKVVTLEEGCLSGGFGSAVLEFAARVRLENPEAAQAKVACLGVPDHFVEHGARSILLDINGLSAPKVADSILRFTGL